MEATDTPPFYRSPSSAPTGLALLRRSLADPASVIPRSVYDDWAVKLPGPFMPLVVSRPDDVRRVLLDDGAFGRNLQLRRLMRRAWGAGLAAAEGESWTRQRHAAAPAFRPRAVDEAKPVMTEVARRNLARWRADEPIELHAALGRIVTEIVVQTLLASGENVDFNQVARDIPPVTREVTTFGLLDAAPLPDRIVNRLRRLGRSAEERRLRALAHRLAAHDGPNLLAQLRGAGPLADNALGFLIAGLETTALGAAWAAFLLALYPEWQDAIRADATVATQVAREALRLYPPAPILARAALRRTTLAGRALWLHQTVIVPVYAIHRHRRLWDRPDAFDPARFGPGSNYDRSAFLPFGAGPRLCIAAAFATAEIAVILSQLVGAFQIAPAGPAPEVSLRVGTHAVNGLHVRVEPIGGSR